MEMYQLQSVHNAEVRSLTSEKDSLLSRHASEIKKINMSADKEIEKLQNKIKSQRYNEALQKIISGEDQSIMIPKGVRFKRSFTPVKGNTRPQYPYGDYTIFIVEGRAKYHCSHQCAPTAKPLHFFDLPRSVEPCQRCVPKEMYPQPLPDWYYQIQEKLDSQF